MAGRPEKRGYQGTSHTRGAEAKLQEVIMNPEVKLEELLWIKFWKRQLRESKQTPKEIKKRAERMVRLQYLDDVHKAVCEFLKTSGRHQDEINDYLEAVQQQLIQTYEVPSDKSSDDVIHHEGSQADKSKSSVPGTSSPTQTKKPGKEQGKDAQKDTNPSCNPFQSFKFRRTTEDGQIICICHKICKVEDYPVVQCDVYKEGVDREHDRCQNWYHYQNEEGEGLPCVSYKGEKFWICPICKDWRIKNLRPGSEDILNLIDEIAQSDSDHAMKEDNTPSSPAKYTTQVEVEGGTAESQEGLDGSLANTKEESVLDDSSRETESSTVDLPLQEVCDILGVGKEMLEFQPEKQFTLEVTAAEFREIYSFKNNDFKDWAGLISRKLTEKQLVCSFTARRDPYLYRKAKEGFAKFNGHCSSKSCEMKFEVVIRDKPKEDKPVQMQVTSSGAFFLKPDGGTGRPLSGSERRRIKDVLKTKSAVLVYIESMSHLSGLRLLHGNNPYKSVEALRMAKNENKKTIMYDKDIVIDLAKLQDELCKDSYLQDNEMPGFIRLIQKRPFRVDYYCAKQLKLAHALARNGGIDTFFDATAGMLGKIEQDKNENMVFNYALVVRSKKFIKGTTDRVSFVMAEFMTNANDQATVHSFFLCLRRRFMKLGYLPRMCDTATCDFSWVMLHTLIGSLNSESIQDYMERSWGVLNDANIWPEHKSYIIICIAHLLKAFSNNLSKKNVPKKVRKLAIFAFAKLTEAENLMEFRMAIANIILMFGQRQVPKSHYFKMIEGYKSRDKLEYDSMIEEFPLLMRTDNELDEIYVEFEKQQVQRNGSPFYQLFLKVETEIVNGTFFDEDEDLIKNEFRNSDVVNTIKSVYVPYFCFFGKALIRSGRDKTFVRSSSAPVESYFSVLKTQYYIKRRLIPGLYLREHVGLILGIMHRTMSECLHGKVIRNASWTRKTNELDLSDISSDDEYLKEQHNSQEQFKTRTPRKNPVYLSADHPEVAEEAWRRSTKVNKTARAGVETARYFPRGQGKQFQLTSTQQDLAVNLVENTAVFELVGTKGYLRDLASLVKGCDLNDIIINTCGELLTQIYGKDGVVSYISSNFAFTKKTDHLKEEARIKKVRISSLDRYFVQSSILNNLPDSLSYFTIYNDINHWILLEISVSDRKIYVYDSLQRTQKHKYICQYIGSKLTIRFPGRPWEYVTIQVGTQVGGYECGEHTLLRLHLLLWASGKRPQLHIPRPEIESFRFKTLEMLLNTTELGCRIWYEFGSNENTISNYLMQFKAVDRPLNVGKFRSDILKKKKGNTEVIPEESVVPGEFDEHLHAGVFKVCSVSGNLNHLSSLCGRQPLDEVVILAYIQYIRTQYVYVTDAFILDRYLFTQKKSASDKRYDNLNSTDYEFNKNILAYAPYCARWYLPFKEYDGHWFLIEIHMPKHLIQVYDTLRRPLSYYNSMTRALTSYLLVSEPDEWVTLTTCEKNVVAMEDSAVYMLPNLNLVFSNPEAEVALEEDDYPNFRYEILLNLLRTTQTGNLIIKTFTDYESMTKYFEQFKPSISKHKMGSKMAELDSVINAARLQFEDLSFAYIEIRSSMMQEKPADELKLVFDQTKQRILALFRKHCEDISKGLPSRAVAYANRAYNLSMSFSMLSPEQVDLLSDWLLEYKDEYLRSLKLNFVEFNKQLNDFNGFICCVMTKLQPFITYAQMVGLTEEDMINEITAVSERNYAAFTEVHTLEEETLAA